VGAPDLPIGIPMAFDAIGSPEPATSRTHTTDILQITFGVIAGVVILGALFGAIWLPGVGLVALAALLALALILERAAAAMNEPGNFGQGLTAVITAVSLVPAAIGASLFIGVAFGASDSSPGMSYEECLAAPSTTFEECWALR
jgi:hypothetical protein